MNEPRKSRSDFQELALLRLEEARVLRDNDQPSGAYYLAGYAVECALKACIAKQTKAEEFPPKEKTVRQYYTHNLEELVAAAELSKQLKEQSDADDVFSQNWNLVKVWNESVRYENVAKINAEQLISAIEDSNHGVLQWLRNFW